MLSAEMSGFLEGFRGSRARARVTLTVEYIKFGGVVCEVVGCDPEDDGGETQLEGCIVRLVSKVASRKVVLGQVTAD